MGKSLYRLFTLLVLYTTLSLGRDAQQLKHQQAKLATYEKQTPALSFYHPVQATTLTYMEWITFAAGTTLGATIEMSINVSDQCLSSVAATLQSAYLVFYYLSSYLTTNSDDNVAYATSYLVKMMRSGYDLSYCSTYISNIEREEVHIIKLQVI